MKRDDQAWNDWEENAERFSRNREREAKQQEEDGTYYIELAALEKELKAKKSEGCDVQ